MEADRDAIAPDGAATRGLLFTSIPKAGKNLVFSFLNHAGIERAGIRREEALWSVERPWLRQAGRSFTYAQPSRGEVSEAEAQRVLESFLEQLVEMGPGLVQHHHFPFSERLADGLGRAGVPTVFLYRDPRDTLLSMADYVLVQRKPAHVALLATGLSRSELVQRLWHGDQDLLGFEDYLGSFAGWRDRSQVVPLRFEDLVGAEGGGDAVRQERALRRLSATLPSISPDRFRQAMARTFNRSAGTFFRGVCGRWREETDPSIRGVLDSPAMRTLIGTWGYGDGPAANQ